MQRFYIKNFTYTQDNFSVKDTNIVYQLVKVLRSRIWDKIIIFNGEDSVDYVCCLQDFSKKEISLILLEKIEKNFEKVTEVNLYQSLPNKLDKIEYILQKWVEVWVRNFTFFRSERSQKLSISDKKKERLEKIITEAVEQCGWNSIPTLELLDWWLELEDESFNNANIFLHTQDTNSQSLKDFIWIRWDKNIIKFNIFVWPEWWFSEMEVEKFEEKKFQRIHLWNRILRTETAWVVSVFMINQLL